MSPYCPLYFKPVDVAFAIAVVFVWLAISGGLYNLRDRALNRTPLGKWWAAARGFISLCVVLSAMYAIGCVFLGWLKLASPFWLCYELAWLIGTIAVFYVLPLVCIGLVGWALVVRWRSKRLDRTIFAAVACPFALVITMFLYFGFALVRQ